MTGSRFLQPKTSRFLQKVATPISRFVARHRTLQRIVRRIPIVTKFLTFFVPGDLDLAPPEIAPEAAPLSAPQGPEAHITPVYNRRARKPRGFTFG